MANRTISLLMILSLMFFVGCSMNKALKVSATQADDAAAQVFIQHFFDAFDSRDYDAIQKSFVPDATVVHNNGVITDIPEMLESIRSTREWTPRKRELSGFQTRWAGDVVIVGLRNQVTFEPQNRPPTTATYNETWVLQRTTSGLKALRVHYSLVTAEKHSEDVK